MRDFVAGYGEEAIVCRHWEKGSAGITELAEKVADLAESGSAQFSPLYPDRMGLFDKINTIVQRIYRGSEAIADKSVRDQLHQWEKDGYGDLPVCMAKTQYSFSTDPNLRGAPTGHAVAIREVRLSAGAGFIVAITGSIMTMPGLPRMPSAEAIRLNEAGEIEGLF
jgi:formate--tetrahydrofolate ligase